MPKYVINPRLVQGNKWCIAAISSFAVMHRDHIYKTLIGTTLKASTYVKQPIYGSHSAS